MYQSFSKVFNVLLLTLFLTSLGDNCLAQESPVDSLLYALDNTSSEQEASKIKAQLAWELFDVDNTKALGFAKEAYLSSTELGDSAIMVRSGRLMGQLLRRFDRVDESIQVLSLVYPIAKRNNYKEDLKRILNALALAYTFKANYDKALEFNFYSLVIRERDGNKNEISITLNNIGLVYFKLKNYEKAIEYYKRSLALKKEVNDFYDLDRLLINLGLCYNQLTGPESKFNEAQGYINQALSICDTACSELIKIEANFGLGVSYFGQKKWDTAEDYFEKSLSLARAFGDKRFQAENLVYLGKIDIERDQFETAVNHLTEAKALASNSGYNQLLMDIYKQFSSLYNKKEDFQNAAFYQDQYIQLKDSLISEDLVKNVARIQTNFEERENIATIATKERVIKQQRDLNIAVVVIALLAGLLLLVVQRSNRNIKRVNAKLSEAQGIIQEQNKLLERQNEYLDKEVEAKTADLEKANQSLKQVNDELDNFIYKTSHDIRGPLASLRGMCNVAMLDVKDPVALDYLSKLDLTAERLNTILTRLLIVNQINNSKLNVIDIDLASVIEDVMLLERKRGIPEKINIKIILDEHAKIKSDRELVRIVLENLIDNAIKFYNESERVDSFVEIRSESFGKDGVKIRVIDNGIGISESNPGKLFRMFFRASERSETGGIGLYIVKTATLKLNGKVELLTTPEGFTEFNVTLPNSPDPDA